MNELIQIDTVIPEEMSGKRLDQALAKLLPEHSRARLQGWIRDGYVLIDKKLMRPRDKIQGGEQVEIRAEIEVQISASPENIPLQIVFEDEYLIIINKPAGLIVHPGAGNPQHTLMNALLHHDQKLEQVPRAGIVHRLDKDTSGLLVIARTPQSHTSLVKQLQTRDMHREYVTIVSGTMTAGGTIDQPIGRHPKHRTRMAIVKNGRTAITHYRIIRKYRHHTQLQVNLETGRTHQIRVHMTWHHHPIIGDPVYGTKKQLVKGMDSNLANIVTAFPRQALHARAIQLLHPHSDELMTWEAPIPEDITALIDSLELDAIQQ
ncbi:MAG: 23S rRNA pseudouridine(1911/1915/1917) synthase RluD [Gammaproteobacteria bacterium]